jgi:hypothetical protein
LLHLWLPYAIIAELPVSLRYINHIFGLCVSLVLLSIAGSVVLKTMHFQQNEQDSVPSQEQFPLICTQITAGALCTTLYLLVRSFLEKFFHFLPAPFELELPVILTTYALVQRILRGASILPTKTQAWVLFLLLCSILTYGRWHFFTPYAISSDPGVLSGYLEIYRRQGEIPFFTSAQNPTLPIYPPGIFLLMMPFANPLLPSVSLVHIWIYVSAALAGGIFAEWFIRKSKLSAKLGVVAFGLAVCIKLWSVPVDLNYIWINLEGLPKRSMFAILALGGVLLWNFWQQRKRARETSIRLFLLSASLLTVAWMIPVWVNPTNFFISLLGMLGLGICLLFYLRERVGSGDNPKTLNLRTLGTIGLVSVSICCIVALYSAQDPLILSLESARTAACSMYPDELRSCTDAGLQEKIDHVRVKQTRPANGIPPLQSLLPRNLTEGPDWWVYPSKLEPFHSPVSVLPMVFIACAVTVFSFVQHQRKRRLEPNRSKKLYVVRTLKVLSVPLCFVTIVAAAMAIQTVVLQKATPPEALHMLRSYTEQGYLNIWGTLLLLITGWASALAVHQMFAVGENDSPLTRRRALGVLICLAVLVAGVQNYFGVSGLKKRVWPVTGGNLHPFAEMFSVFHRSVTPGDKILIPSQPIIIPWGERWVFPEPRSAELANVAEVHVQNGYPNFWAPSTYDFFEHFQRICDDLCSYMTENNIKHLAWIGTDTKFCERNAMEFAQSHACLEPKVIFEPTGKTKPSHEVLSLMLFSHKQSE